jgi:hypothetical protein
MSLTKEQGIQLLELELALLRGDISRDELNSKASALNLPVPDYLREAERPIGLPQPFTITAEQLIERSEWEQRLMRGEISLADALELCMSRGVPVTANMRDMFAKAVLDYQDGKFSDLAEPLGIAMSQREKKAEAKYFKDSHVDFHVDAEYAKGKSKENPSHYSDTAFEAASAHLGLAPASVHKIYYRKK